jgi:hypothetical protein
MGAKALKKKKWQENKEKGGVGTYGFQQHQKEQEMGQSYPRGQ